MENETLGDYLHPDDKRRVLNSFVYRMTVEAQERWPKAARYMRQRGYRMPDRTDDEWLSCTYFRTTKAGRLDNRCNYCRTISC